MRACDNPFAVHRVLQQRYRLDEREWSELLARLERQGNRGAIVGPHGSGKTTLLEDLGERLKAQGLNMQFLSFNEEKRKLSGTSLLQYRAFWLVDGAEQLRWTDWWRLKLASKRAGGFVITTHKPGRLPLLHRCETSPALLCDLTHALDAPVSAAESAALYVRHRGNLRDALRELYDWYVA